MSVCCETIEAAKTNKLGFRIKLCWNCVWLIILDGEDTRPDVYRVQLVGLRHIEHNCDGSCQLRSCFASATEVQNVLFFV